MSATAIQSDTPQLAVLGRCAVPEEGQVLVGRRIEGEVYVYDYPVDGNRRLAPGATARLPGMLTAFGVLALTFMMLMYALERRGPRFVAAFACVAPYRVPTDSWLAPGPSGWLRRFGRRSRLGATFVSDESVRSSSQQPHIVPESTTRRRCWHADAHDALG